MTEDEWLACDDPGLMIGWLTDRQPPPSERKFRLLLAGCARQVWDQIPPGDLREAVETAERFADGAASPEELSNARDRYYTVTAKDQLKNRHDFLIYCLAYASSASGRLIARPQRSTNWVGVSAVTAESLPGLIRCVFGNPFGTIATNTHCRTAALSFAETIYQERTFDRLPILADELEDAGCDNDIILTHLRSDGPHVRGAGHST